MNCPACKEEFNQVGILAAHFRHHHTDYEKRLKKLAGELSGCKGLTPFARWCLVREQARAEIEAEVEAAIVAAGGRQPTPPHTSANIF
jgi:hypothetical protein